MGWDGEGGPGEDPRDEEQAEAPPPRRNWVKSVALAAMAGCCLFLLVHRWGTNAVPSPSDIPTTNLETPRRPDIMVDVKGQVRNPGVVKLEGGSRVFDAIKACGGFTENANRMAVNLAAKVHDEQMIRVPAMGEALDTTPSAEVTPGEASATPGQAETPRAPTTPPEVDPQLTPAPTMTPGHFPGGLVDAIEPHPAPTGPPRPDRTPPRPDRSPARPERTPAHPEVSHSRAPTPELTPSIPTGGPDIAARTPGSATPAEGIPRAARVSINRATVEQLANIPGMTARLAADVVAYRRGPPPRAFTSVDELSKVPGMNPAKVEEILPYLKL